VTLFNAAAIVAKKNLLSKQYILFRNSNLVPPCLMDSNRNLTNFIKTVNKILQETPFILGENDFFEKSGCKIFKALSREFYVLSEKHGIGF